MNLLGFPTSYFKAQRALQWWSQRQSRQLSSEAEKIREGLLQETFTLRRSLERSLLDDVDTSTKTGEDCLQQVEHFYHSLEQLSERLAPAYVEDSLPLAIQDLVESWRSRYSRLKVEIALPMDWSPEPIERSLVILRVLDELLEITLSKLATDISLHITLKQQGNLGELIVQIAYPDVATLMSSLASEDLEYLSQTFSFLTSGQCFHCRNELSVAWYFRWEVH